jgi:hypothetical protein
MKTPPRALTPMEGTRDSGSGRGRSLKVLQKADLGREKGASGDVPTSPPAFAPKTAQESPGKKEISESKFSDAAGAESIARRLEFIALAGKRHLRPAERKPKTFFKRPIINPSVLHFQNGLCCDVPNNFFPIR